MKSDIYAAITDRFIEQLKKGTVPWRQPWLNGAQNIVSRKPYRGINCLLLGSSRFGSPYWMTYRQASELGGNVRKGEKSHPIIYYKFLEKKGEGGQVVMGPDGRPATIPFVRWSNVFNLEQTEGIAAPAVQITPCDFQPLEKAAAIVENAKLCPIYHSGFVAVYHPEDDFISVPSPQSFRSPQDFYHTVFHEQMHSTGHQTRLNREGITQWAEFASPTYCREELIAEIGAAFLSNEAGILDQVQFESSASYLNSWIRKLEDDPKLIVSAASQAQHGSDLILGLSQKEALSESQALPANEIDAQVIKQGQQTRLGDWLPNRPKQGMSL